jgi:hypothetical protein
MFESLKSSIDRMEGIISNLGMGSFQKTVVIVFLLLLVVILIFLGIMINNNKSSKKWPPVVSNCPDYWLDKPKDGDVSEYVSGSNCTGIYDKNVGNFKIDSTETVTKNFTEPAYMGSLGNCEKSKWANANGISWDGVNYGVNVDPNCK